MTVTDTAARAIQLHSLRSLFSLIASCAPDSSLYSHCDIDAAIVPAAPYQPMVNAAAYASPATLRRDLPSLAAAYRRAGVRTWVIWVPESHTDVPPALHDAGYVLSDRLPAMVLDLAHLRPEPLRDLDYDSNATLTTLAAVNQECYPNGTGLLAAFANHPVPTNARVYQARRAGAIASALLAHYQQTHYGLTCAIYFVGTLPDARRRRLAARLLTASLLDARAHGCTVSALQASPMGAPLYEALGYQTAFHYLCFTPSD